MTPDKTRLRWEKTCRLVPSRYPTVGVFDRVASPDDLPELFELEGWTNDRLSAQAGLLHLLPRDEWVVGPMSSVVMAAFCHPSQGGRFNDSDRGAWYASRTLDTALAESTHRRGRELEEIGVADARMEMRLYYAGFDADFHDVRSPARAWDAVHDPDDVSAAQRLARTLLDAGSNGIVYRSVRHAGGECLACFRPKLVKNVQIGGHFEYRWRDGRAAVRQIV